MALHPLGFPTSWQMESECSVLHVDDDYEPHLKRARAISAHIPLARTQSHCRTRKVGKCRHGPPKKRKFGGLSTVTAKLKMFSDICPPVLSPAEYTVASFNTRHWR